MSNHANGDVPAALNRAARRREERASAVPPSLDVQEATLANVIGEAVAVHVAKLLAPIAGQLLQQAVTAAQQLVPQETACALHTIRYKQQLKVWRVAVENAQAAAEEPPAQPEPGIPAAFTWVPMRVEKDGPMLMVPTCFECAEFEAVPAEREVGLLAPNGAPIVARRR